MKRPAQKIRRLLYWVIAALTVAIAALAVVQVLAELGDLINGGTSMENTIMPGNRLLLWKGDQVQRGDLVVVTYPAMPGEHFLRRLVGLPRDRVACCTATGQVTVNGLPLRESYVYPGDAPSAVRFSVALTAGQVWLMGDHRSTSYDSRLMGPAAMTDIVGRIFLIDRNGTYSVVRTPAAFIADGLAPADHRLLLPVIWLATAVAAVLTLLILLGTGLVLWLRHRNLARPAAGTP